MPTTTFFNLPKSKRERIIESAIEIFSNDHYAKVTVDKIAIRAEIPKGSFYQYFENKDDLYVFLFEEIGDKKKNILEATKDDIQNLNFKFYVMRLIEEGSKFESEDIKLIKLKEKFINECPQEIRKEILENEYPKSYELLVKIIKMYIEKGELRSSLDAEITAYIITQCVSNLSFFSIQENETPFSVVERFLDTIIDGIKA